MIPGEPSTADGIKTEKGSGLRRKEAGATGIATGTATAMSEVTADTIEKTEIVARGRKMEKCQNGTVSHTIV